MGPEVIANDIFMIIDINVIRSAYCTQTIDQPVVTTLSTCLKTLFMTKTLFKERVSHSVDKFNHKKRHTQLKFIKISRNAVCDCLDGTGVSIFNYRRLQKIAPTVDICPHRQIDQKQHNRVKK